MCAFIPRTALCLSLLAVISGCASGGNRSQQPSSSSSTVTAEDLANNPNEPIEKILERKVTGVAVTRTPSGGIALRIRGAYSPDGDNSPLYVLNGLEISAPNGELPSVINPFDIETIKVLKGPEASLYGIRGANGVIVITTKKPPIKRD